MESVIVVVEDEPELLELVGAVLEGQGYAVVCLKDPALLATLSPEYEPWLFLLDLMMPVITGIELAGQLRADGHAGTPIVAMSASDRMLTRARDSGLFNATVAKPFDVDKLLRTIGRYGA